MVIIIIIHLMEGSQHHEWTFLPFVYRVYNLIFRTEPLPEWPMQIPVSYIFMQLVLMHQTSESSLPLNPVVVVFFFIAWWYHYWILKEILSNDLSNCCFIRVKILMLCIIIFLKISKRFLPPFLITGLPYTYGSSIASIILS